MQLKHDFQLTCRHRNCRMTTNVPRKAKGVFTYEIPETADLAIFAFIHVAIAAPKPTKALNCQQVTVCGGRLQRSTINGIRALNILTETFRSIRERSEGIVKIFNSDGFLLSGEKISSADLACISQIIPQLETGAISVANLPGALNETFTTLTDILSLLEFTKADSDTHPADLDDAISSLGNVAMRALCSLNHLSMESNVTLPRQFCQQPITTSCSHVTREQKLLIQREIFSNIGLLANEMLHMYTTFSSDSKPQKP